jgi:hypothetical protein
MNGVQRLARAERDCTDLHKALADAIKRIAEGRGFVMGAAYMDCFRTDDLLEVLNRTAQTDVEIEWMEGKK